ncbi:hydrogenase [Parasulfuritortus cantonensis]|uniref:Hydrogenase expression/formation protein n=1 Tax=Parasulfuritortus cantonensis TaxID=2528202 RepID=A0A4R1BIQ9_9PROT|nr:hydrogenase [Parasulfuritortus cantonensis]TCJ17176.1 hydrogenase [Parasulfuritortus cantonensis]
MTMNHPLLDRLAETVGRTLASEADLAALAAEPGDWVLFCGGNPSQFPECLDVAVVLPELLALRPGRLRAAVVAPGLEAAVQARYGFSRWPSLVFLRQGDYVGTLSGMQDWTVFVARLGEMLAAPASRPPGIGIPVAAAQSAHACH